MNETFVSVASWLEAVRRAARDQPDLVFLWADSPRERLYGIAAYDADRGVEADCGHSWRIAAGHFHASKSQLPLGWAPVWNVRGMRTQLLNVLVAEARKEGQRGAPAVDAILERLDQAASAVQANYATWGLSFDDARQLVRSLDLVSDTLEGKIPRTTAPQAPRRSRATRWDFILNGDDDGST